jgi:hypothetical protein
MQTPDVCMVAFLTLGGQAEWDGGTVGVRP